MSYYVISAVSFIGPGVNFGGSLPLEHPSGAPLHGSGSSSVGEQCFELMWASLCCLRPPRPPAWQREERVQWAAECLGTCYNTLPTHTAEALGLIEKYSWWWDLKKLKLVCPAPVAPIILLIFVCVTACLIDLLSPWLVLVHWPKQWSCLLCFQEFLKVLAEQNEPYTSKHSLPFLPRLDLSTVADSPLNTFTSSGFPQEDNETERKMELKEKLIKAKLSLL